MLALHSPCGRHFLGLRQCRRGRYEIVYDGADNGRRLVLIISPHDHDAEILAHEVEKAIVASAVLDAVCAGLRSAAIEFEVQIEARARNSG